MYGRYVLQPRFIDMNTTTLIDQMESDGRIINAQQTPQPPPFQPPPPQPPPSQPPLIQALLCDTANLAVTPPSLQLPQADEHLKARCRMVQSQEEIYLHTLLNFLSIVWGPPGGGKSHLLSVTIIRLLITAASEGKQCRILVTAYTHEAINLLLTKIARLLAYW